MFRIMILKEKIFITYHMFFLFIRHTGVGGDKGQRGAHLFFRGINIWGKDRF